MVPYDFLKAYFLTGKSEPVTKGEEGEIAYLFEVGYLSSIKRYAKAWSLPSSTEGKDNRGVEVTKVVLLYRANLPYGVKPNPWHVRPNRLSKPLEELHLLLLTEQQFTSGKTLKLKDEFGFLIPELLRDLPSHPIEPRGDLLLISAREPDTRSLWDFCFNGD
jgi:hypothetical protein